MGRLRQQHPELRAREHNQLGIPIIYGVDGVHGHNNLSDATTSRTRSGSARRSTPGSCTGSAGATGKAVRATGIAWDFAPVLDTERDLRWGRCYEPFGEDPLLNGHPRRASTSRAQGRDLAPDSVAATAKHFTGYSAPDNGHDRTNATISESELQDLHLPPFERASTPAWRHRDGQQRLGQRRARARVPPPAHRRAARSAAFPRRA